MSQVRAHPLHHRVPPPVLVAGFGVVMWAQAQLTPPTAVPLLPRALLGGFVIALGWALVSWGFLVFREAQTTIDPVAIHTARALVTSGPFARTRNPMYVGFAVMLMGWAVVLGSVLTLVEPLLFVVFIDRFQVRPEEAAMRARFGDEYGGYASRVPRWLF